jgi:hypothetical protein
MRSQIAHIGLWTIGFLVEDGLNNCCIRPVHRPAIHIKSE